MSKRRGGKQKYGKGVYNRCERATNCYYCDRWLTEIHLGYFSNKSIDHFIPKAKGGRGFNDNLVICCRACNDLKGNLLPDEFIDKVKRLLKSKSFQKFTQDQLKLIINRVENFKQSNSYQIVQARIFQQ